MGRGVRYSRRRGRIVAGSEWHLTDRDLHPFHDGTDLRRHEKFGTHPAIVKSSEGTQLSVLDPSARSVSAMGNFDGWGTHRHPLRIRESFVPGACGGHRYRDRIASHVDGDTVDTADPLAFHADAWPQRRSDLEFASSGRIGVDPLGVEGGGVNRQGRAFPARDFERW